MPKPDDKRRTRFGRTAATCREMPADLVLAMLDVIDSELAQEGPAALAAEHVARAELARIQSLR